MSISVIVFDLGNVLLPFDYSKVKSRLDEVTAGLGERFEIKYYENYQVHREYEKGAMSDDEFLNRIMEWTENKIDKETFCRYFSEIFTVNIKIASLLPILKENYRICLLSNTSNIHRIYGWKDYEFLRHFEKLFLSYEVGANKPEPEIYQAVMKYTDQPADQHLFIDDIKEYVEGAKKLGWNAIQFLNEDQCIEELKKQNIKF